MIYLETHLASASEIKSELGLYCSSSKVHDIKDHPAYAQYRRGIFSACGVVIDMSLNEFINLLSLNMSCMGMDFYNSLEHMDTLKIMNSRYNDPGWILRVLANAYWTGSIKEI